MSFHVLFNQIIPTRKGNIIRGTISASPKECFSINIAFSKNGQKVSQNESVKPFEVDYLKGSNISDRKIAHFSALIPNEIEDYQISITSINLPESSVVTFSKEKQHELLDYWGEINTTAGIHPGYNQWVKSESQIPSEYDLERQRNFPFENRPLFSIVVPLYNTPMHLFNPMFESVIKQTYLNWELILVNSTPNNKELAEKLSENDIANNPRVKIVTLDKNYGITGNTNAGTKEASGDFVSFFDHDDVLDPRLLFEYALALQKHPDIDILYCDEDKLYDDGTYSGAFYKPDFSIDQLRNNNYICHLLTIRKQLLEKIGPTPEGFDGAQDHWLTLRSSEEARRIWHVRKVLYHWRATENSTALTADNKPYASAAGVRAVQDHLNRIGIPATVENYGRPFTCRVKYHFKGSPLVSILIPNKDNKEILETCVNSILEKSTYTNFEILIIENNSIEKETFSYYESLEKTDSRIKVIKYPEPIFNYSAINNFGAKQARGEYLLFLNNDTEVISPNWLETLIGYASRREVGAVGVRLFYPDDTYQHAGLAIGGEGVNRLFINTPREALGYFSLNDMTRNVSAVTAACMMVRRECFEEVLGFDEELAVAFNDVDFCLRLRKKNLLIVYTADVDLYHYESFSRGLDTSNEDKSIRMYKELFLFKSRWAEYYIKGDPYFNNNLEQFEPGADYFKLPPIPYPKYERSKPVKFMAAIYHKIKRH